MHFTHIALGGVAVIGAIQFALVEPLKRAVLPPEPPIVVHSLEWRDGAIVQDRTVTSDGKFTAAWQAEIRDVSTGLPVPGCYGSGVWTYDPGRIAPEIPLAEWVGNPDCRLARECYQANATYEAGTFKTTARSPVFCLGDDG